MHSHMTKDLDNRLAAVEGHIAAIRRMLAEGRDCDELLLQLIAKGEEFEAMKATGELT